jgi:cell wall-associated NlpC family hydrolase
LPKNKHNDSKEATSTEEQGDGKRVDGKHSEHNKDIQKKTKRSDSIIHPIRNASRRATAPIRDAMRKVSQSAEGVSETAAHPITNTKKALNQAANRRTGGRTSSVLSTLGRMTGKLVIGGILASLIIFMVIVLAILGVVTTVMGGSLPTPPPPPAVLTCVPVALVGSSTTSSTQAAQQVSAEQQANARTIIGISKSEGLPKQAAIDGIAAGLDESSLLSLANTSLPQSLTMPGQQGSGSNGLSIGVFQQQVGDNWSTQIPVNAQIAQLLNPAYAAQAFFGTPHGWVIPPVPSPSALTKGLSDVAGWETMAPGPAIQAVQASGTPSGSNYTAQIPQATALVNQLYASSPPVPLPIAVHPPSGTSTANTTSTASTTLCPSSIGESIVHYAEAEIGKPYVWGGGTASGPSGAATAPPNQVGQPGFDCSGLVLYALAAVGITGVVHLAAAQYHTIESAGLLIPNPTPQNLQPGDLVFYIGVGDGGTATNPGHVAIYAGNGQIIQAPQTGQDVSMAPFQTTGLVGAGPWPGT